MERSQHPVWEVYDLYRTARLNVKYYSCLLHRAEIKYRILEVILLCAAPTSSVAGLWFWETSIGQELWKYFGAISAIAAVIMPVLGLPKKIKEYESIVSGYRTLEHDLQEIKSSITHKRKYDEITQGEFKKALKRKGVLVGKEPDSHEIKRVKARCINEVLSELPSDSFFVPEE
jgi:hypothetical protein